MGQSGAQCEIIAEAGVNHDGDEAEALKLVAAAAQAGADTVKFQTFDPDELATAAAPTAAYQAGAGEGDRQAAMLRRLTLPLSAWARIAREAQTCGVRFLSTPFDVASARFLIEETGLDRIKVGSGELTNLPLLLDLARLGRPLLLSTGMATTQDVRDALGTVVFAALAEHKERPSMAAVRAALEASEAMPILARTVVMQCVTAYPAPHDQANLRVLDAYAALCVIPGYSDHTLGIDTALAAAARGARVIEKHLTLDRDRPGPDHKASLEPDQMAALVLGARRVTQMLGSHEKAPVEAEIGNMAVARRGLVAVRPIRTGDVFSTDNLAPRRAGGGAPPARLWDMLGQRAGRDYGIGDWIDA
jgi:N-acetylneuraminate synthase